MAFHPSLPRITRPVAAALLTLACMAAVAPALASSTHSRGAPRKVVPPLTTSSAHGLAMISPLPGPGPNTANQVPSAARTCVKYATGAGFANNGYYSGDLVTAAAICVAESAGDPRLYVCDENGTAVGQGEFTPGQPINCPAGTTSYDRGLWQLNTGVPGAATDRCAFNALCNADFAYNPGETDNAASLRGLDFAPWASYDQGIYSRFIDPVQAVVTNLRVGTVTSALLGECLTPAKSAVNARVVIRNCGIGSSLQQWSLGGGKLRSGSACATIGFATSGVVLRKCARSSRQEWQPYGRDELRNAADGKCLTDPKSSLASDTQVDVTACANAKNQTWWLP